MIALDPKDIGGGFVRRAFSSNGVSLRVGDPLTAEQITAWPASNRRALINNGFVEVYPIAPDASAVHGGGHNVDAPRPRGRPRLIQPTP